MLPSMQQDAARKLTRDTWLNDRGRVREQPQGCASALKGCVKLSHPGVDLFINLTELLSNTVEIAPKPVKDKRTRRWALDDFRRIAQPNSLTGPGTKR